MGYDITPFLEATAYSTNKPRLFHKLKRSKKANKLTCFLSNLMGFSGLMSSIICKGLFGGRDSQEFEKNFKLL